MILESKMQGPGQSEHSKSPVEEKKCEIEVLVVDDNHFNLNVIGLILDEFPGVGHMQFFSAEEALSEIEYRLNHDRKMFDFMFIDINMPVMNGFEFERNC